MTAAVIMHPNLFNVVTGSSEKLLRDIALILADSGKFDVRCVYRQLDDGTVAVPSRFRDHPNLRTVPFTCERIGSHAPWRPKAMVPSLDDIMAAAGPAIFICMVSSGDQWPITSLGQDVPMLLISPFGDFCSNGNVRRLYVSGVENVGALKRKGVEFAEVFYNPLRVSTRAERRCVGKSDPIVLGRVGRADSAIFDPISLRAFGKLEEEFGDQVSYVYVNPSPEARQLVADKGIKRVIFREWLSDEELESFYDEIDIFAHARSDGETVGIAIAEAMLHGCAVASHRSLVFNEHLYLLNPPYGLVADVDDVDGYYRNLRHFMVNRERLREYGDAAQAFAEAHFGYESVGQKLIDDCAEMVGFIGRPHPLKQRLMHSKLRAKFWVSVVCRKLLRNAVAAVMARR